MFSHAANVVITRLCLAEDKCYCENTHTTMSFGFSVSDIIGCARLANKLYDDLKQATGTLGVGTLRNMLTVACKLQNILALHASCRIFSHCMQYTVV